MLAKHVVELVSARQAKIEITCTICTEQAAWNTKNCAKPPCRMPSILCSWNVRPLQIAHSIPPLSLFRYMLARNFQLGVLSCANENWEGLEKFRLALSVSDHCFDSFIVCVAWIKFMAIVQLWSSNLVLFRNFFLSVAFVCHCLGSSCSLVVCGVAFCPQSRDRSIPMDCPRV